MKHQTHIVIISLLIVLALGSCTKDDREPTPEPTRVLLAYIGTDNNLSGMELEKIKGLRDGWTGKSTDRIFAYADSRNSGGILYELSVPNDSDPFVLASYGKENSASPEVFARVINDVITAYPAGSYGLLIFSHASGWLPGGTLNNPVKSPASASSRSIIIDGGNEMELAGFASSIPTGVFGYIAFEACFMAGIEVAYELRNKAPYILASSAEIVHPGFAPVYPASTSRLLAEDLQGFGKAVFNHTLTYSEEDPQRSATYSVIRTAGLETLAAFVRDNCDFSKEVNITGIQRFDRNAHRLFFDFGDYYSRLLHTEKQRAELDRLIGDCIDWKAATTGFMTQGTTDYNGFRVDKHSGLTAYIPQAEFLGLNEAYRNLQWSNAVSPAMPPESGKQK